MAPEDSYILIASSRISVDHSPNGPSTRLHLNNLQVSDDGVYLCESTFIEPMDTCNNLAVYNIEVKVLGERPPPFLRLLADMIVSLWSSFIHGLLKAAPISITSTSNNLRLPPSLSQCHHLQY